MLSHLFWTIAGLGLAGGAVGIAAAFIPSLALLVKAALDFMRSPIGTFLFVILAGFTLFALAYAEGDVHGSNQTRAAWRADNADKAAAAAHEIAANKLKAAFEADQRIAEIDAYSKSLEQKVADYEQESAQNRLKDSARDLCRLSSDDIKRLRAFRN